MSQSLSRSNVLGTPLTKSEAISMLQQSPKVYQTFQTFEEKYQQELLQFIIGEKSLHVTYDTVFKKIFDLSLHADRMESLLSAILSQPIKIIDILPCEGKRLSADSSLVIMDIVAQLEDGSYLDIEIQKIGYAFPGERTCCYASDLILRQYDRLRVQKGKKFSYHDMKPVHIIVLMEESADVFKAASPYYMHKKQITYDSGVSIADLTEIVYISLDTFKSVVHNKIDNPLHAWLTFLSTTDPRTILELIGKYPDFLAIYQEIAAFRTNPKELITMFSEALAIMDHNTELYMIEEAHKKLEGLNKELESTSKELETTSKELETTSKELDESRKTNAELQTALNSLLAWAKEHGYEEP